MNCPECGEKTTVIDLAPAPDEKYRKRKCRACGHKFYTIEYEVEYDQRFKSEWVKYNRAYIRRRNESSNKQCVDTHWRVSNGQN